MKREIPDYLGLKQCLTPGAAEVTPVGSGKGKQRGNVKGESAVKLTGQCVVCGKTGHRKSDSWWTEEQAAKSRLRARVPKASLARKDKGKVKVIHPNANLKSVNSVV